MNVEQTSPNELTITGNIKSIQDSIRIKEEIGRALKADGSRLKLHIRDSFSMTSTVIGFLMKLVHQDKVQVSIVVEDSRLYELLDELQLVKLMNVSRRS